MNIQYGGSADDLLIGVDNEANVIFGGAGNDALFGGALADTVDGGDGNDSLWSYAGDDWLHPGQGVNAVSAAEGNDVVLAAGFVSVWPPDASSLELKLLAYPYAVNTVAAGAGDDVVRLTQISGIDPAAPAAPGRQYLDLGAGADTLELSCPSPATIFGGDGDDLIWKTDLRTQSYYTVAPDAAPGWGTTIGLVVPDNVRADPAWQEPDIVAGGAGADHIRAGDGDDQVWGGDGDDWLDLGAGANLAWGGEGRDIVIVEGFRFGQPGGTSTAGVRSNYPYLYAPSTNAVWAGAGDDVVSIAAVSGGQFGTTVHGEAGDDWIGVASPDGSIVTGGDGNDTLVLAGAAARVSWNTDVPATPADVVYGDAGDDLIYAGHGDDLVFGGAGRDWIFAGAGNDSISCGDGTGDDGVTDRLSFEDPSYYIYTYAGPLFPVHAWSADTVVDFQPAARHADPVGHADKIDLAALLKAYEAQGYYGAANPFAAGHLQLVAAGADMQVQIALSGGGWATFLTLAGVLPGELDTAVQADLSGGLAAAGGGDFLWFTG